MNTGKKQVKLVYFPIKEFYKNLKKKHRTVPILELNVSLKKYRTTKESTPSIKEPTARAATGQGDGRRMEEQYDH